MGKEGEINADIFKRMLGDPFLRLNMEYEEVWKADAVDWFYFYQRLVDHGYLFVVYTTVQDIRHANVIWAADEAGNASVMDPMRSSYINKAIEEFKPPFLVAWASTQYWNPYTYNPY